MEKKKLLLVAVSVGIFLIIVIGLSILIFLPKNQEQPAGSQVIVRSNSGGEITPAPPPERVEPASIDVMDMLRNREETQGLRALPYQPPAPPPSSPENDCGAVFPVG